MLLSKAAAVTTSFSWWFQTPRARVDLELLGINIVELLPENREERRKKKNQVGSATEIEAAVFFFFLTDVLVPVPNRPYMWYTRHKNNFNDFMSSKGSSTREKNQPLCLCAATYQKRPHTRIHYPYRCVRCSKMWLGARRVDKYLALPTNLYSTTPDRSLLNLIGVSKRVQFLV